jgi:hypothetical protein
MVWLKISDRNNQEKASISEYMEETKKVIRVWRDGDYLGQYLSGRYSCPAIPQLKEVGNTYLKCNKFFLQCFIKETSFNLIKIDSVEVLKNGDVTIDVNFNAKTKKLLLKNNCHEVKLPQRWYGYGSYPKVGDDIEWNNFDRDIYVDKYQVNIHDVYIWDESRVPDSLREDTSKWHLPATFLLKDEMVKYCLDHGKQIMNALIFDALSFHPIDLDKPDKTPVFRSPNPWTVKYKNTFLNPKLNLPIDKNSCAQAYVKECKKDFLYTDYLKNSVSWSGVFQILGGEMEFMRNPIEPNKNLFVSSSLFSRYSAFHSSGLRFFWDGLGHRKKNFDFLDVDKNLPVAFRCFRYD